MTARENLIYYSKLLGMPQDKDVDELLNLVGLQNTDNKQTKQFSLGMKQRLSIAIALIGSPDFLILDEPINGLDPSGIIEMRELILKLNEERAITVLISSHILILFVLSKDLLAYLLKALTKSSIFTSYSFSNMRRMILDYTSSPKEVFICSSIFLALGIMTIIGSCLLFSKLDID